MSEAFERTRPPFGPKAAAVVARRKVFYLPGYDPFPPRRYRELYRRESAAQAAISGYDIALRAPPKSPRFGWNVTACIEGQPVSTEIEVLLWSDLVRHSMRGSVFATYRDLARTAWIYIRSGTLWRLGALRKGPLIAGLYPAVFLLGQLALALALAAGAAALFEGVVAAKWPRLAWLGWVLGLAAGYMFLRWCRAKDGKIFAWYLMQDFAHSSVAWGAYPPDLAARIQSFASEVEAALGQGGLDEVLVVGHSSGAHIGVSVLAEVLRRGGGRLPEEAPELSFLTLGQAVPMVSFLPKAQDLRRDLYELARGPIFWLDVSAPGDGCSFALCDPVAVSGQAEGGAPRFWPVVISAAFSERLAPATWARLKRRWFRLHFQYLCAFDNLSGAVDDYEYFKVTAGPLSLAARFHARRPSASRIEITRSKYTDRA